MFCSSCGKQNPDNAKFCDGCGQPVASKAAPQYAPPPQSQYNPPQPQYAPPPPPQYVSQQPFTPPLSADAQRTAQHTSGLAITSLILGIIGFSLFAIIFGGIALNQIGKNPNLTGKGLAITGLVLGILGFIIELIWILAIIRAASSVSGVF